MTCLSTAQLLRLYTHIRIPDRIYYPSCYSSTGEEVFHHYIVYNRVDESRLKTSRNYFGGDPCGFTYSIRISTDHIYAPFYHKITGGSMRIGYPSFSLFVIPSGPD